MANEQHDDMPDVAESFVTTFYHDSDDEINMDGDEDGDIFELYGNSRPLTPLEHKDPEGTTADRAQYSDDPSDQISVIDRENVTFHERNQRFSTDTIKLEPRVESSESREENDAPSFPRNIAPENEATSKNSAEENTPVEDA
ncbi:hypothetical protein CVT25_007307 [Psilocybe cyanescens]|uniref:Uncharacterized protein n=1 Tax=Psilocybe cyanescens TaxID=93625 RepID=A0A409XP88_PSICY|nr:hypothetical protein CVT25_007307 [Psilocybe cyanescens]